MCSRRTIKMWEHNGWGDSVFWTNWEQRRVCGFLTNTPKVGDLLQCKMESGRIAVFKFMEVDVKSDPKDQFFATVKEVGYLDEIESQLNDQSRNVGKYK